MSRFNQQGQRVERQTNQNFSFDGNATTAVLVIVVAAAFSIGIYATNKDGGSDEKAVAPSAPTAGSTPVAPPPSSRSADAPVGQASSIATGPNASPSPTAGSDDYGLGSIPAGYRLKKLSWGVMSAQCGSKRVVDLDQGLTAEVNAPVGDQPRQSREGELVTWLPSEQTAQGQQCFGMMGNIGPALGRSVGVLKAGAPRSFESCRAAAGAGLGVGASDSSVGKKLGLVKQAAVCAVTDKGAVALAEIQEVRVETNSIEFLGGDLFVWEKL
ncbi:hypothetical protein [Kitasatospora purpeofusca]|uniref:hypothetical protein n=1 Tax=Kitasatospora purpeofusca TaxID=67352 RepID=UPI0035E022A6